MMVSHFLENPNLINAQYLIDNSENDDDGGGDDDDNHQHHHHPREDRDDYDDDAGCFSKFPYKKNT